MHLERPLAANYRQKTVRLWCIICTFIIILPLSNTAFSQVIFPVGAEGWGQGGISVLSANEFAPIQNPATLGKLSCSSATINALNRFSVANLNFIAAMGSVKLKTGGIGVSIQHFGISRYKESVFGIGYGLLLSEKISAGIKLQQHQFNIGQNAASYHLTDAQIGIHVSANEKLQFATQFNGIRLIKPKGNEQFVIGSEPAAIIGISYHFAKNLVGMLEIEKPQALAVIPRIAANYHLTDAFAIRYGLEFTSQLSNTFGIGYQKGSLSANIGVRYNDVLGISTAIGIGILFNQNKADE